MTQWRGEQRRDLPQRNALWSRRLTCAMLLALTLPLGLAWRLAPLGLPPFAFKYGGSALWAVAVYWVVAIVGPRWPPVRVGVIAAVVALGVELGKRIYWPPLDRFRETLAGKLLLGRYFSVGAIVAYWIAICAVVLVDSALLWSRAGIDVARFPEERVS